MNREQRRDLDRTVAHIRPDQRMHVLWRLITDIGRSEVLCMLLDDAAMTCAGLSVDERHRFNSAVREMSEAERLTLRSDTARYLAETWESAAAGVERDDEVEVAS